LPEKTRLTFWTGVEIATVYSPYSPTECGERLKARLEVERQQTSRDYQIFGLVGPAYLEMGISADGPGLEDSSGGRAYLSGFMTEHNGGTRIRCRIGASDSLAVVVGITFFLIWFAFAVMVAQDFVAFWRGNPLFITGIPMALTLLIAGMGHLVGSSARRRSRTLLHLLNSTLGSGERHADRAAAIEDFWRNA
jgi:hypothetical protein